MIRQFERKRERERARERERERERAREREREKDRERERKRCRYRERDNPGDKRHNREANEVKISMRREGGVKEMRQNHKREENAEGRSERQQTRILRDT